MFSIKLKQSLVGNCAIDNDILKIGVSLAYHAFDGAAQACGVVAVDGDYGEGHGLYGNKFYRYKLNLFGFLLLYANIQFLLILIAFALDFV